MDGEHSERKFRLIGLGIGSALFAGSLLTEGRYYDIPSSAIFTLALVSAGAVVDHFVNSRYRNRMKRLNPKRGGDSFTSEPVSSFYPESPETAIARRTPEIGRKVLEEISKNVMYQGIANEARGVSEQYLNQMRRINPDRIAQSGGVHIDFKSKENTGLKRLLFGKGEMGYQVNISLINHNE